MSYGPERKNIFPFGKKERKQEVENKTLETKIAQQKGATEFHFRYDWHDSRADKDDRGVFHFQDAFVRTFDRIIPEGSDGLKDYIERTLIKEGREGKAIGIEFGGPGSRFFMDFTNDFFKKTMGVTLKDYIERPLVDRLFRQTDEERNHTVREANILSEDLYPSIEEWAGEKVDLIIERMAKGLEFIPNEPHTVAGILQKWYGLLRPGGLLLVQVPVALNPLFVPWVLMLRERYGDDFIRYAFGSVDNATRESSVVSIHKIPGAPEALSFLEPRQVRSISKGEHTP